MKKKPLIAAALLLACSALASVDTARIRRQFVQFYAEASPQDQLVGHHVERLSAEGTWADLDYDGQCRGAWPALNHLNRLERMAVAYADPEAALFESAELKAAIVSGLTHWLEKDYGNPNWWYRRIGIPKLLATTLILLGDELPKELLESARPILNRSTMGMTGQNKVWCAGIAFMKGLLYEDSALMDAAASAIWSELRVSTREGIQPDWSFHQHGPQQQFGNYGMSFAGDMIKWASILSHTDYALSGAQLAVLRNYMLHGVSWIIWRGRMDFSGCGRQVDQGEPQKKGRHTIRQLRRMQAIDPSFRHAYAAVGDRVGFKPFWRSEMGVHRRPDWYASVKMSSTRVIGAETCNSENMQGLHLGDGTLLVYREGDEYEDLVPLWDWKRLPGTTCDQGLEELTPPLAGRNGQGGSEFAGVLGHGETGVAAMIYRRNNLAARKAYFFFKDHVVCLGAGIEGETKGAVYTAMEQSQLSGAVRRGPGWVHHDGIGYLVLEGRMKVLAGKVEGNWNRCFPAWGDRPAQGELFSLWVDHGRSPSDATYAYKIFPQTTVEQLEASATLDPSSVVVNSAAVQAVVCGQDAYVVFYSAGKVQLGAGRTVESSGPCLLGFSGHELVVSDPTHRLKALEIKVNGNAVVVPLPQGERKGEPVSVK